MSEFSVEDIANVTQGRVVQGSRTTRVGAYSIDSRTLAAGDFFIALRGPRFDGHEFVAAAADRGASGALVSDLGRGTHLPQNFPVVRCSDTTVGLQWLGTESRRRWAGTLIAVTGSAGKTTTKDFIAELLGGGGEVFRAAGNYNNQYGLPLVLLGLAPSQKRGVVELGMNHAGEIRQLAQMALPDVGVLTNVAEVHLEFFQNIEEIAEAKAELLEGIQPDGFVAFNEDDPQLRRVISRFGGRKIGFGFDAGAVRAHAIRVTASDRTEWTLEIDGRDYPAVLPLAGRHYLYAALAGAAVASGLGIEPAEIVGRFNRLRAAEHRGQLLRFEAGFAVVDDSYNSNPRALQLMVNNLTGLPGFRRRWVVAGEMLELGPEGPALHRQCGKAIAAAGIDRLIGVRGNANWICQAAIDHGLSPDRVSFCARAADAYEILRRSLQPGDVALVKGSRGVRLDEIVERLKADFRRAD